jgi:hypothetical protein
MSGGYFDYQDSYLGYIAEQLERDIEFNDIEYNTSKPVDTPYGFQHSAETLGYLKMMANDLHRLQELLHAYDYAVSGDSLKEQFLESARAIYQKEKQRHRRGQSEKCQ